MYRLGFLVLLLSFTLLAGCATTDRRVDLLYEPSVHASGGSGQLFLAKEAGREPAGIQWVLGDVVNDDGAKVGSVVTDIAPSDLFMSALAGELKSAGFSINESGTLPPDVAKGVKLGAVKVSLNEKTSVLKEDASCVLNAAVEVWRDGKMVSRLNYEAEYSDTAVTDRDRLSQDTLNKALHNLMKQAVPELVRLLEQQR